MPGLSASRFEELDPRDWRLSDEPPLFSVMTVSIRPYRLAKSFLLLHFRPSSVKPLGHRRNMIPKIEEA